ncbi:glycosyltransferase [Vibrio sp. RE86]|uniref:tetratricopeptide repeat-containing glycosyltransferase n=1 Tax=Vibrio sp. RE86 TaxID=2607605 RepID=UPI00149360BA|nr:glycosyltransferase [Vibrio sp. RE86]NOH78602.1 glycosyltransferase [Vibrio sp. RE86]
MKEQVENSGICLTMIVKNESAIIERCLNSTLESISEFVIVDTGSTDDTIEKITRFMKKAGKKGQVISREWKNFAHNRNEAVALAKELSNAKYILTIDADDQMKGKINHRDLKHSAYYITSKHGGLEYRINRLFKRDLKVEYIGYTHEYLSVGSVEMGTIDTDSAYYLMGSDSSRRVSGQKYLDDIALLQQELAVSPDCARSQFYLAQSYKDSGQTPEAIEHYLKRASMGGWFEEVYISYLRVARLYLNQNDINKAKQFFQLAIDTCPQRAEAQYDLSCIYTNSGDYNAAYELLEKYTDIDRSKFLLFLESSIYEYGLMDQYALSCYYTGRYTQSIKVWKEILKGANLDSNTHKRITNNLIFAIDKVFVS